MHAQPTRMRIAVTGAALAGALTLAACGSSGGKTGSGGKGPGSGPGKSGSGSDIAAACAALIKLDAVPTPGGPEEEPSAEENKQFGQAVLPPLTEALDKSGGALADTLGVLKPMAEAAANDGTAIPDDDTVNAAVAGFHTWAHQKCGYQNVDVTAIDYKFEGIPASVKAGPTSIALANHSDKGEFHVALIVQPQDPKITTVEQLLAVPMPELESSVEFFGAIAAAPHAGSGLLIDLKPGRYFVVCPVPVGGESAPDEMDIHMLHGMATTFEVT